ncbi:MAG: carotenoid biosynthesis protein [Anaerolineae bacterium]|nr:carotenoid biosynthesis protein [Anaerolineae bacterium]
MDLFKIVLKQAATLSNACSQLEAGLALERDQQSGYIWLGAVILWLGVWIATPLVSDGAGVLSFSTMTVLGVLAQAATTIITLSFRWPTPRVIGASIAVAVATWLIEFIGSTWGVPFGHYYYTPVLRPQLGGVPLLIPLAWLMMLGPAWGMTASILRPVEGHLGHRFAFAALAGLVFTAWDLYLDPQMVSHGLWVWENPGGYFGIPWVNFAGWWLSATLITLLVYPTDLPRRHLTIMYILTWLFQAAGLSLFWELPGPALVGFVGMGLFVIWGWLKEAHG